MKENPVLLLVHNCLELTKRCVESIKNQDIPTYLLVIDNASSDGTFDWLQDNQIHTVLNETNEGTSASWNWGFDTLFGAAIGFDHILCPNNDTILARETYRVLLECDVPFVTGRSTDDILSIGPLFDRRVEMANGPDFSLFLMKREAWKLVGHFDPAMKFYASDNSWHVEAHRKGLTLWNSGYPFYHERSSTLKNAPPEERRAIQLQADADREVFKGKYGCMPWEEGYAELFK